MNDIVNVVIERQMSHNVGDGWESLGVDCFIVECTKRESDCPDWWNNVLACILINTKHCRSQVWYSEVCERRNSTIRRFDSRYEKPHLCRLVDGNLLVMQDGKYEMTMEPLWAGWDTHEQLSLFEEAA